MVYSCYPALRGLFIQSITKLATARTPINENIKSHELRVVGSDGENFGVISKAEAIKRAQEAGLDLIEISPNAKPPVAKIMDYGKFQYDQKKKQSQIKAKAHVTETKTIQIKIGTGEHDLRLKSKRINDWLDEGHRVKVDLFLRGRYKYMEFKFLKGKLEEFLTRITVPHKVADEIKKSPKGLSCTVEREGKAPKKEEKQEEKKVEREKGKDEELQPKAQKEEKPNTKHQAPSTSHEDK